MSNQRDLNLDLIKVVAMLGVICLHSTHSYISSNQLSVANVMYESALVSIPLFFMVSGYLLLEKKTPITSMYWLRWERLFVSSLQCPFCYGA